jgi:hypothetical protein
LTVGLGLTVILKVCTAPAQPLAIARTDTVATSGVDPVLSALKAGMFPLPDVPKPIFIELV